MFLTEKWTFELPRRIIQEERSDNETRDMAFVLASLQNPWLRRRTSERYSYLYPCRRTQKNSPYSFNRWDFVENLYVQAPARHRKNGYGLHTLNRQPNRREFEVMQHTRLSVEAFKKTAEPDVQLYGNGAYYTLPHERFDVPAILMSQGTIYAVGKNTCLAMFMMPYSSRLQAGIPIWIAYTMICQSG